MLVFRAIVIRRFCINACEKNPAVSDETDCPVSHTVSIEVSWNDWGKKCHLPEKYPRYHSYFKGKTILWPILEWQVGGLMRLERRFTVTCLSLCLRLCKCTRIGEKCPSHLSNSFSAMYTTSRLPVATTCEASLEFTLCCLVFIYFWWPQTKVTGLGTST